MSLPAGAASALAQIPATTPPPGVIPNFVNPPSLGREITVVNGVFVGLMIIVVVIRMFSKRVIVGQQFDFSDATLFIATIGSIAHSALTIYNTTIHYGRHEWDISAGELLFGDTVLKYTVVDTIYVITTYFIKVSLFLLYWNFFAQISTVVRRTIQFGAIFLTIYTIPYLVISILRDVECTKGLAALSVSYCENENVVTTNIVFGTVNLITDLYILAIPISQLYGLHLPLKKKLGIMGIFLAGFAACAMSIVRLGVIISKIHSNDTLYTAATTSIYSAIEMKLAIICCCAVYFPGFFRETKTNIMKVYGSLSGSSRSSNIAESVKSEESDPVIKTG